MRPQKRCSVILVLCLFLLYGHGTADEAKPAVTAQSLEIEQLKLQIEQLKLENQRLQLQIKTLQVGAAVQGPSPTPTVVNKEEGSRKAAKDMAEKAAALAKDNSDNGGKVVLDLDNGEIWYKKVHYNIAELKGLFEDQKWPYTKKFIKFDMAGDSQTRYQYQNIYLDRYGFQKRGILVLGNPSSEKDFSFITPEGLSESSSFTDFRNGFETAYYRFDHEEKNDGIRMLQFKHGADFLGYDDVLEVYFDKTDHFMKLRWGMLDRK